MGDDGAVGLGFAQGVAVDERAEDLVRALLVAHQDGRAGEADAGAVGQARLQRGLQVAGLAAVCLVHQHEDVFVGVEDLGCPGECAAEAVGRCGLAGADLSGQVAGLQSGFARGVVAAALLLDHAEDDVGRLAAQVALEVVGRGGAQHLLAGERCGVRELLFEVGAVGDDDNLEAPQRRVCAQLAHQEHHRQALAGTLRVPDDAAAAVVFPILGAGGAGAQGGAGRG